MTISCSCLQQLGGEISCQVLIQHMLRLDCLAALPRVTTMQCCIIGHEHDNMSRQAQFLQAWHV